MAIRRHLSPKLARLPRRIVREPPAPDRGSPFTIDPLTGFPEFHSPHAPRIVTSEDVRKALEDFP